RARTAQSAAARVPDGSEPTILCSRFDLFQTGMIVTPCCAARTQAANCGFAWCANRSPTPSEYFSRDFLVTNGPQSYSQSIVGGGAGPGQARISKWRV